jgi:hypothetical protein
MCWARQSSAGGGALDQLERVRGHADETAGRAGRMAAAARPLEEPGDALRAADLQHLIDGAEIDAEVEARRGHHALHGSAAEASLGLRAEFAIDGPVVQGHRLLPVGTGRDDRVEPSLGLRPRVGEDERGRGPVDRRQHLGQQSHAHVTGPRKSLHRIRDQGLDLELSRNRRRHQAGRGGPGRTHECGDGVVEVGERGRQPPGHETGPQRPQSLEREFCLHAPLRGEEFVPLVHDHGVERGKNLVSIVEGEQDRERLGRGDQRRRPVRTEPATVGGR